MRARRLLTTIAVALPAVALAACGGASSSSSGAITATPIPATTVAAAPDGFAPRGGLVKAGDSAASGGEVADYVPKGEIIADSGFRPWIDGFAFENYGNDVGPVNLGRCRCRTCSARASAWPDAAARVS